MLVKSEVAVQVEKVDTAQVELAVHTVRVAEQIALVAHMDWAVELDRHQLFAAQVLHTALVVVRIAQVGRVDPAVLRDRMVSSVVPIVHTRIAEDEQRSILLQKLALFRMEM